MLRGLRTLGAATNVALLAAGLLACTGEPNVAGNAAGEPWPGLSQEELAAFATGRDLFHHPFTPDEGLGPTFNQARCSSCHDVPTLGGAGTERAIKATRFENGRCDRLTDAGGDMFQQRITPALQASGYPPETIPRRATAVAVLAPPPLYGLGAIEAIPDAAILEREDPEDRDGDGISGRAGRDEKGRVGRFGRKANVATIRDFVVEALSSEMGLTTSAFPQERNVGGQPLPAAADPARDPEIDETAVRHLTRYVQLLARPAPDVAQAARDSIRDGERIFHQIGCAACHTPALPTGPNSNPVLDQKAVPLYSDLLLHDMGPELASVCAPHAGPAEWRTAPLHGLALRMQYLHDGRAQSASSAIGLHGGEADRSRRRFEALTPEEQARLLRFLRSL